VHQWVHELSFRHRSGQSKWAGPSLASPFIYAHVEKTGGTHLRDLLADHFGATKASPKRTIIPCHTTHCVPPSLTDKDKLGWNLAQASCALAFAGHYSPLALLKTLVRIDAGEYTRSESQTRFLPCCSSPPHNVPHPSRFVTTSDHLVQWSTTRSNCPPLPPVPMHV
jgi:hypothetical protein